MKLFVAETTEKMYETLFNVAKKFFTIFLRFSQILLGLIVMKFDWKFYRLNNSSSFLMQGVLSYLDFCLDQRLRFWIRMILIFTRKIVRRLIFLFHLGRFFTPLVSEFPFDYVEKVLPALHLIISHCFHRLSSRWQLILTRLEQNDDEDLTHQETFLEDSTRLFTRDYVNFLSFLVRRPRKTETSKQNDADDDENDSNIEMDDNDEEMNRKQKSNGPSSTSKFEISDLGVALLNPQVKKFLGVFYDQR